MNSWDYKEELTAGVDEAGRGPLIGNVVAAAVILGNNHNISGLRDSKKLTEKKRALIFDEICNNVLSWGVGKASPIEIDEINILQASLLAMQRAVANLSITPKMILVDGNRTPDFLIPAESIIKGDDKVLAISAASIIAKVTRDREMIELDQQYPEYGFAKHKGYPTKDHLLALQKYGPISEHRKTFGPVRRLC